MTVSSERVWTPSEVRRLYQDGERNFDGLDISDAGDPDSFRGAMLDDARFTGCFIVADFTGASLRRARLVAANVKTCVFARADLCGADFSGAALDATDFAHAGQAAAQFRRLLAQARQVELRRH
jgi:uncharacterized protein YjbI with pentapeptide repeats